MSLSYRALDTKTSIKEKDKSHAMKIHQGLRLITAHIHTAPPIVSVQNI